MPSTGPLHHVDFQRSGAKQQEWLSDPRAHCPLTISTLKLDDLQQSWKIHREKISLPREYHPRVSRIRIPLEAKFYRTEAEPRNVYSEWTGIIGPGMIIIEAIGRSKNTVTPLPYTSQLTKAAYEEYFNPEGLKYVFVDNIVNEETNSFMWTFIYPEWKKGLRDAPPKSFAYNTADYQALLGTRIGKVVVYFLLNTFARGTRRISKIVSWVENYTLQLRFDIEHFI
ncbi:hypothetical protein N7454_000206 [Penicillium verhagenii]|nr:hypothetical protein N7454_000206 [Penicillium verhagenii]